ncbi:MAG TPA: YdcF family protein [Thermoleophilaceae bacterium]
MDFAQRARCVNTERAQDVLERHLARSDPEHHVDVLLVFGTYDYAVPRHAADLLTRLSGTWAIVSGANSRHSEGWEESEAVAFTREIARLGVERSRIAVEPEATSTVENIRRALSLAEASGRPAHSWGLVTRELQALRTWLTFRQLAGLDACSFPAPGTLRHPVYGDLVSYRRRIVAEYDRIKHYGLLAEQWPPEVDSALSILRKALTAPG